MPRIVICDDEALHRAYTHQLIQQELQNAEIQEFDSGEALLRAVTQNGFCPDIAVLDIRLTGEDGISTAQRLNTLLPCCQIIFLTGYLSYAPDVYDARHIYFVLKSQLEERIGPALRQASGALAVGASPLRLRVPFQSGVFLLPAENIFFLERCGRKTRISTGNKDEWTTEAPQSLLAEAGAEEQFIRCHQSYWVNRDKIAALRKNEFCLTNGSVVPLSRSYRQNAREQFLSSLRQELPQTL